MKKVYYPLSTIEIKEGINDQFIDIEMLRNFAKKHNLDESNVCVYMDDDYSSVYPVLHGTREATEEEKTAHYNKWAEEQQKRLATIKKRLEKNVKNSKSLEKELKQIEECLKKGKNV